MTTEVLILNKHAVVLAADSAVTATPVRDGEHPRYSKTANKLFELCNQGNIAVMIYGGAQIDGVPWEIVVKLFRSHLGNSVLATVDMYLDQLLAFIKSNQQLFGPFLTTLTDSRFEQSIKYVLDVAMARDNAIFDKNTALPARQSAWQLIAKQLDAEIMAKGHHQSLSAAAMNSELGNLAPRITNVANQIANIPELAAIDAPTLSALSIKALYCSATEFLQSTGLVVAGYGEQDIFPGYRSVEIFGHIGNELLTDQPSQFHVTHTELSMIKGWAQTSMIDVFTDGFGFPLWQILRDQSRSALTSLVIELQTAGMTLPQPTIDTALDAVHQKFMKDWTSENYRENWRPLRSVLASLGVQEMAHLAETLLTLQAVKERVTSSSESVGGPIDVAAITKAEGLVWLKRKHFFEADLNLRYVTRMQRTLHP